MLSVAIIGDLHDWHSQQIESSLKKRGCRVIKLKFDELQANFQKGKFFLNPEPVSYTHLTLPTTPYV